MKKIILICVAIAMLTSCGAKKTEQKQEDYGTVQEETGTTKVESGLIGQGAALIKKSDCNTCHHLTSQIIGPSHTDVARKYEFTKENIKMIAERIIKGGSGVWGQVMMTPHPNLSQEDAEKMARYVLSLDGEKEPD